MRYTKRATNDRPYTRYLSNIRLPLRGAVAMRLRGGFIRDIQSGRPMIAPTHVTSIHMGAVASRLRGGFIRDIQSGRPMVAPTHVTSIHKGAVTSVTEGDYYSLYILLKLLKFYESVKQIFSPILTSIIKEQKKMLPK